MSVPTVPPGWLTDASAIQMFNTPDHGMHSIDPTSIAAALDPHHFQQQLQPPPPPQQQQRAGILQNGNSRNASPGYPNPQSSAYQVNPVVPLKRARRDDSISISPRQTPGTLPPSRSQTPNSQSSNVGYQPYPNSQTAPRSFATPYQYSHLQHAGSANASPSPVLQNQPYNSQMANGVAPGKPGSRQSPSPFSPNPQQQSFLHQGSPPQVDQMSQVSTPQSGQSNGNYPPNYNAAFPTQSNNANPHTAGLGQSQVVHNSLQAQIMHAQIQQQQQHQQQAIQNQIAGQNSMHIQSQMQGQARPMKNMPVSAMKAPPTQPGARQMQSGSIRPQDFMKQLLDFMQSKGTPILNIPKIGDNSVDLFRLFSIIMRMGGSRKVNTLGQWPAVVAGVGLSLETSPTVVEELREIFSKCLGSFESAWIQKSLHHNQQSQQQQHPQQGMQPAVQSHNQMLSGPPKAVPSNIPIDQGSSQVQPVQNAVPPQTPVKNPNQGDPRQHNGSGPAMNPPITPQNQQIHSQSSNTPNRMLTQSSPLSQTPFGFSPTLSSNSKSNMILASDIGNLEALQQPVKEEVSTNFKPKVRGLDTHGGVDVAVLSTIGWELNFYKPTVPTFSEHGVIDIHALTMSLKSGLTSEVRLALDTLATVSVESRWSLSLESCEDLVETLVDVAESEVGLLAKHVEIASETIRIPAYEDVMRGCRSETETLMDVPKFGSLAHRLEKAADKLICITTIFRNLSFFESNHAPLAEKNVVTFLSGVIRLLGTRYMLLRTYANTLDFLKDMIIYLSNLSQTITLPSKDEAANLLHLILAFAPQPCPTMSSSSGLMFASYQPSIHRYLPPAVDSLAKLLARDEPNRSFYRTIFLSEGASTKKYDLMTRSFGLAISPIPDNTRNILPQTVEARKPFLEQGMLAAEIIAGMAPGSEDGLAKSWLTSEDGFALSLLRLVCLLSPHSTHFPTRPQPGKMPNPEETQPFSRITHRGMGVLQKLAEKSEDPSDPVSRLPLGILPKKESLLGALLTVQIDGAIVKQLCTYAGLND